MTEYITKKGGINMEFTLDDLKTGHIVKFRNGDFYIVIKGDNIFDLNLILLPLGGNNWSALTGTKKDFYNTISSDLDIVKVYNVNYCRAIPLTPLMVFDKIKKVLSCETKERVEELLEKNEAMIMYEEVAKKMTITEISEALGYPVEIVEE